MELRIALLPGDGVGPEVVGAAVRVLEAALPDGWSLRTESWPVGWAAVREAGAPLPPETREACLAADAVLLGAVGHPDADAEPRPRRPETGLLALRRALGCWANLRPVRVPDALVAASALRPERVRGTDLLVVRELAGGLYYGEPRGDDGQRAWNTLVYTAEEVRRIARHAVELARTRSGRITSVDKANVLEVSGLWRRVVEEVAVEAGEGIRVEHMLVDRTAMELAVDPRRFDVLLTGNLFGDILSDQAAGLPGSLGVLPSASLGGATDLYEPVHGSAPELEGRGTANPVGAILSTALMLRHTFGREAEARRIEAAVEAAWNRGIRTADLPATGGGDPGESPPPVGTGAFTDAVVEAVARRSAAAGSAS